MNNTDSVFRKILRFIKDNTIWTIIGVIVAIIPVIWTAIDRANKPKLEISIKGLAIDNRDMPDIYYLIPREAYEGGMKGAVLFSLSNIGKKDLANAYLMVEATSEYVSKPAMDLWSGKEVTSENHTLRFRRLNEQDYIDNVAGEKVSVTYSGEDECLTAVFRTVQRGIQKNIQPVFSIDREWRKGYERNAIGNIVNLKVLDFFNLNLAFGATDIDAERIDWIDVFVAEYAPIEDLIGFYERNGVISDVSMVHHDDIKSNRRNCILIYPKFIVEDGVVNADIENGQYYYIEYDALFKSRRRREMVIKDLNDGQTRSFSFTDTPERADSIKRFYKMMKDSFYKQEYRVMHY